MSYKMTHMGLGLVLSLVTSTTHAATWQVGIIAENSHSPFLDNHRETNVLPLLNYTRDRFSFVSGEIQYSLSSGEGSETYIMIQQRSWEFYSSSLDSKGGVGIEGMKKRLSAFELGLGLKNQTPWGQLVL